MLNVQVHSIPMTEEEKARWKREDELCPMCQKPFGQYDQVRLASDVTIHKHCAWGSAQVIAESSQ
jgi:hypothetical protein